MIKKLLILLCFLFVNNITLSNTIFSDYRISFNKIYLTNYIQTIYDTFKVEDIGNNIYFLNDTGEFHIHDGNGRELKVNLKKGIINGTYEEYYTNGNIFTVGNYIDGKKEGKWQVFSENGKLLREYSYKNDKLDGLYHIYYSENGNMLEKSEYKYGKLNGKWGNYYSTGEIKNVGYYVMGKREGLFKEFYKNGKVKSEIEYSNGVPIGKNVGYYENGNILYEFYINNRDGIIKGYNMEGILTFEGEIENGKRVGVWKFYNSNQEIILEIDYSKLNEEKNVLEQNIETEFDIHIDDNDSHDDHNH